MAFTLLTPVVPVGPYPQGGVSAGELLVVGTACDATNGNSFPVTGHEVLAFQNTDGSNAHTVTIYSVQDEEGRTGDITNYSIPSLAFIAFSFLGSVRGWKQTDGTVHFLASNALVVATILYVSL